MKLKRVLISFAHQCRVDSLVYYFQQKLYGPNHIKCVFYHDTPKGTASMFERHIKFFSDNYVNVGLRQFGDFLETGEWEGDKPGVIISFDDGLRSNFDIAVPILDNYGFKGWHFVPSMPITLDAADQLDFAKTHNVSAKDAYKDGRIFLSEEELRELEKEGHVIGCHTKTHYRMVRSTTKDQMHQEIIASKRDLDAILTEPVSAFCWVGGEEYTYNKQAAKLIREAGFKLSFTTNPSLITPTTSNFALPRTYLKSDWPYNIFMFQMSGVMDLVSMGKTIRTNRVLS